MKIKIHYKQVNSNFDKERFEWFDGEEPSNLKYHFTHTFELKDVKSKTFESSSNLTVYARLKDNSERSTIVEDVSVLECLMSDGSIERFFASKDLIRNNHETYHEKSDTVRFYFYLKDDRDFGRIDNVTLLTMSSFDEEFLNQDIEELWTDYKSKAKLVGLSGGLNSRRTD